MEEISERILKLMENEELTASQMADRIGVQRSAISHLVSGRNRPSLDLVMKVLVAFPGVSSEWLLRGAKVSKEKQQDTFDSEMNTAESNSTERTIDKVLILYSDRTVVEYRHLP